MQYSIQVSQKAKNRRLSKLLECKQRMNAVKLQQKEFWKATQLAAMVNLPPPCAGTLAPPSQSH
eukprot:3160325-Amphidinium_carterae.1